MSVLAKSLSALPAVLKTDYAFISIVFALLFVIADGIGIFVCLKRAGAVTRWASFLVPMSVYFTVTCVVFTDLEKFVNVLLKVRIGIPPVCGFIAAVVCGILCTGFSLLICAGCVMRTPGRISLCLSTVLIAAAEAFLLFRVYLTADGHMDADLSLGSVIPWLSGMKNIHTDIAVVLLSVLFIAAAFLCFIANKDRYEIAEGEKNIRAFALEQKYGYTGDDAKERFCCRYCQYASSLQSKDDCMLCEICGVTDANHICTDYVYDPLKKVPAETVYTPAADQKTEVSETPEIPAGPEQVRVKTVPEPSIMDTLRKRANK